MKKERQMKFDLFVREEFFGTFKCPYDESVSLDENTAAARNSFLFMFEAPIVDLALKNVVVK